METSTPPLFERIPEDLFRPLAANNNRRYWDLLSRLMAEMWGEGGRSPGEEAPKPVVIRTIEFLLVADDPWGEELGSGVNTRAHNAYTVLSGSGWLSERRRGVIEHVTVRPIIARFFTLLSDFAYHQPEFIGGQVHAICVSLREVAKGTAPQLYTVAAKHSKQCLAHIANTGCRIQDVMDELLTKTSAKEFTQGFFEHYIDKVFIADYSDLRTNNHPLQFRSEVIKLTLQLQHDAEARQSLIGWYAQKLTGNDFLRAESLYERDTRQLLRLREVEEHLHRLDEEIRVAYQRALALFEYKLRSPGNFDRLIHQAINATRDLPEGHIALPGVSGFYHASGVGLAKPRAAQREQRSTPVEKEQPTIQELAMEALRQKMNADRNITPVKLAQYVARHLGKRQVIRSDDLSIESIIDLCCYQKLLLIASRDSCPPDKRSDDPHLQMVQGMHVSFVPEAVTRNEYMEHQQFVIRARSV
ncbi:MULTISPECIES: Wadjet anti-phage system protein JetA family protein [Pseudomonas]|uniref:Wadjet anti-phage system protein JetA family protein n=1 Tax=Pseudomonas TaxID=286 RepID=UPI0005A86993|nr:MULTISPECIES: Wadjet anti-phage system protein JetA family protein [Pseudomonas]AZD36982.1 DNA polymerase III alpha subunit [Pseudomonas chlororaphis subsp. aurantiaca]AZD43321.1 DNA polymerase III alpha subunit [Pseudomonas chlororaphis subsp. aurantiaca]AZD49564.1 DNA polymerase III alpha subunit [Pseudomonas chlororaphis subsp. aurantiaca]AZD80688.1 DNA polymerase III alpha subunit [Pseudomonas chlororaphis subsp. aurantiaca]AZD93763.1 DNA polymerase III alpha subunit [Pseudomonas chloro